MLQFQQNINKLSEDALNEKFEQMLVGVPGCICYTMYIMHKLCVRAMLNVCVCVRAYVRALVHVCETACMCTTFYSHSIVCGVRCIP